jgi:hypothetical protein
MSNLLPPWTRGGLENNMLCEFCKRRKATQRHHIFPQYKRYKKKYGKLLDEDFNIKMACGSCNISHRNVEIWNECMFRYNALKLGYKLPKPTDSFKNYNYK